jgi:hypothetical protein
MIAFGGVLLLVGLGAVAGPFQDLIGASLQVKKPNGTTMVHLHENGDVELGGKLLVQRTDILAELKNRSLASASELRVGQVWLNLNSIPLYPKCGFWGLKKDDLALPVTIDLSNIAPRQDWMPFFMMGAALAEPIGDEVIACWITPEAELQEDFNSESQLTRLSTGIVDKNKIVVVSSCVGKRSARGCFIKLTYLYREKSKKQLGDDS